MKKITAFVGPPFSGKTDAIIEQLSGINPFEYILIGSKGAFVKWVGDLAVSKFGAVNRSAFKTVDQFAVETVKYQKGKMFADKALKLSILSSVVDDMSVESLDVPPEVQLEANSIRRKSTIEKLLSFIDDVKSYERENEFENAKTFRDMFIHEVIERFKRKLKENDLFDTYDAYDMVARGKVDVKGKCLFVDGFYDFPPIYADFFRKIFSSFERVFITVTSGQTFKDSKTILDVINTFKNEKVYMKFRGGGIAKGLFFGKGDGVKTYSFEKKIDEVEWVARKIKGKLLNKASPKDFEIVVESETSDYLKSFEKKFDEYGIPVSYLGVRHLSKNTFVQKLMLPLRAVTSGYPTDMLMSVVLAGFVGDSGEFGLIYDMAHLNRGYLKTSGEHRAKDWKNRIENFIKYLHRKKRLFNQEREDLVYHSDLDEILRFETLSKDALKVVEKLFHFLSAFERDKTPSQYTQTLENSIRTLRCQNVISEDDKQAIEKFDDLIWKIEGILSFMKIKALSPSDYRYYVEMQIKDEKYTSTNISDAVKISDILTSRFDHVPCKFFVGFVDGKYPSLHVNYFYNSIEESEIFGTDRMSKRLRDDKLDFYVALSHSDEAYLTIPQSTSNGIPIIPSIYIDDILRAFDTSLEKAPAILPMSRQEAIIDYMKSGRWNKRSENVEKILRLDWMKFQRKYTLNEMGNVEFCAKLAKEPVSFYRFSTYDKCPLRFFFSHVLRIPETVTYELDLSAKEVGVVFHNALRKLLIEDHKREELKKLDDGELHREIEDVVSKELERVSFFEGDVFDINVLKLSDSLFNYVKKIEMGESESKRTNLWKYKAYDFNGEVEAFKPSLAELGFGLNGNLGPVEIDGVKFVGRLDRIDVCPHGKMVVDYKSGNAGDKRQLSLYSMMYEKTFEEPVIRACFTVIKKAEVKNMMDKKKIDEVGNEFVEEVKSFLEELRKADFRPTHDCKRCDFSKICPARGDG